jgi:hypothetical protein
MAKMKNILNLIIKMALFTVVLALLIPVYGKSTWTQTLITALILTILAYVIIDLWMLPKFGNWAALLTELVLSAVVIWVMKVALPHFALSTTGLIVIALVLTVAEWLFHYYLLSTHAPRKKTGVE